MRLHQAINYTRQYLSSLFCFVFLVFLNLGLITNFEQCSCFCYSVLPEKQIYIFCTNINCCLPIGSLSAQNAALSQMYNPANAFSFLGAGSPYMPAPMPFPSGLGGLGSFGPALSPTGKLRNTKTFETVQDITRNPCGGSILLFKMLHTLCYVDKIIFGGQRYQLWKNNHSCYPSMTLVVYCHIQFIESSFVLCKIAQGTIKNKFTLFSCMSNVYV